MGLRQVWDEHVLPRIIRCGCGAEPIMDIRRAVVPLAEGRVFELGCGGGLNQTLYDPARVSAYAGIDPSERLLAYARQQASGKGWQDGITAGVGEALPYDDAHFDTVVCTFTLCSVENHAQTLAELHRVLRPGGRLLYAEHGRAPDAGVVRWQQRLEPAWKHLFGNCHLTRPVTGAITEAGFDARVIGARYMQPGPRFAGWMEWGVATRQP